MKRVGIELSASHCRIVETIAPRRAEGVGGHEDVRVRAFASIQYKTAASLTEQLRSIISSKRISRRAWVTVWGVRNAHQFLLLPPAAPRDLDALARREARGDLAVLQVQGGETACGVAIGGMRQAPAAGMRREVALVAASAEDVRTAIEPLVDAGFAIDGVATPALALTSLARRRRGAIPGRAQAYLAVNADATGLAIVRDGLLVFAREIPWGYQSEPDGPGTPPDPDELAARLASELRRSFLFFKQTFKTGVDRVITCGDLPHLRSITAPLMTALELEVETLDSMEGIDVTVLPAPVDEFRAQIATLRLAWAVTADGAPPINLLPSDIIAERDRSTWQRAIGAGVAAGVAVSALLFWQTDLTTRTRTLELRRAQQELSLAEPRAQAATDARERQAVDGVRLAALAAFDAQGPRLARALEAVGQDTPAEVVLSTLKVRAAGGVWRVTITGAAVTTDPALAQGAVNRFLRALQASPYFGAPVRPAALKMTAGDLRSDDSRAGPLVPPGMSGIEFSVDYDIRK